jgi:2,4'-dihydroxyacetophenone dioxygenase
MAPTIERRHHRNCFISCLTVTLVSLLVSAVSAQGVSAFAPSRCTTRTSRSSTTSILRLDQSFQAASAANGVGKDEYQPYQGKQASEALPEIFVPQVMPEGVNEDLLWVPQTDTVSFRPLCFCVSSGYYVNLLRVKGAGLLSRHKHPGPVHGHVLKGRWKYLEHEWEAKEGSYVFEPPGEIHTLVVPEGVEEMITLFHVTGSLLYCDPQGKVTGAEDVFTKLELAKKHYKEVGLGEDFVEQFVR